MRAKRAQRKRVVCIGHGPIFFGPHHKSPWEDVWLRWHKGKPSRGMARAAPTLECAAELRAELEMNEEIRRKPISHDSTAEERQAWYREEDAVYAAQLKELETQPYSSDTDFAPKSWDNRPALGTVVTKANGIDRAEAERMLAYYLGRHYGLRNVKFVWKRPDFCVQPAGFGNYDDEGE